MRVLVANTSTFFPPRQLYCILMTCTGTVIVSLAFFLLNLAAALVWSTLTGIGTVNAYCDGMLSDTELAAMSKSTPAIAGGTAPHGEAQGVHGEARQSALTCDARQLHDHNYILSSVRAGDTLQRVIRCLLAHPSSTSV